MLAELDPVAIVIGTVGYIALGFVWYAVFASAWVRSMGLEMEEMEGGPPLGYIVTSLAALIAVCALAILIELVEATTWEAGLAVGALVGIGFVATTAVQAVPFEGRPWVVYLINAGYNIVALSGVGVLLALW